MTEFDPADFQRALRQTLQLYRLAGIEQFPRIVVTPPPGATAAPAAGPGSPTPPAGRPGEPPWRTGRASPAPSGAPSGIAPPESLPAGPMPLGKTPPGGVPTGPVSDPRTTPGGPVDTPIFRPSGVLLPLNAPPSAATRDERRVTLEQVDLEVRDCRQCDELATTRTKTVFGVGDPAARILFLGEAPGADEDRQGEPFVGAAGQLLNSIIEACRLTREEIYICNVLKCRPPGNRVPHLQECRNCRPFLDRQLATVDPDFIICWGTVAAQNLLQTTQAIGKLRRQFFRHGRARVLCTYHPSYLLRTPSAKKDVWEDMKLWRLEMGVDLNQKPPQR